MYRATRHCSVLCAALVLMACSQTMPPSGGTLTPASEKAEAAPASTNAQMVHRPQAAPAAPPLPSIAKMSAPVAAGLQKPYLRSAPPNADLITTIREEDRERYQKVERHGIVSVAEQPVSTFSIDVDTGSYSNLRRFLNEGRLPPRDAVRVEELVNYFPYDYPRPKGDRPFEVTTELAATPWNPNTLLLRIGIQTADPAKDSLPPANLVLLIDISGSMNSPEKLPLLKNALKLFVQQLRPQDKLSIVTYASGEAIALPPTSGNDKATILAAISNLNASGSTAGAAGIQMAYQMAEQGFMPKGINRILLATDGDFNVGITNFDALKNLVEEKRKSGVSLSSLGFGTGNYNEQLMEQIADAGNGAYSYIDTLQEAQKVLVDEFTSTLATVASDVKIQLEFNPTTVKEYRQIGFENRALKREDFSNDKVDAGEIGAGHRVTALYEISLSNQKGSLDPLRYRINKPQLTGKDLELGFLRLRYKSAQGQPSQLLEFPISRSAIKPEMSGDFRFAAAVAAFGQRLSDGGKYLGNYDFAQIRTLATAARGDDRFGYRGEFVRMLGLTESLASKPVKVGTTQE
ncbi:vWA domain-containing protein [Chitinimonas sp. PSY-7]|uniref:YfbK domain-containing protein n=1 Tax=Chitinimonas sp. PSY-7 TaxID=3459088 RepID=UPI0040403163